MNLQLHLARICFHVASQEGWGQGASWDQTQWVQCRGGGWHSVCTRYKLSGAVQPQGLSVLLTLPESPSFNRFEAVQEETRSAPSSSPVCQVPALETGIRSVQR